MSEISRRDALRRSLTVLAAVPAVLAACKKDATPFTCTNTAGLSPAELAARTSLQYVDHAADPGRKCSRCQLYTAGAPNACGGCTVVKGPIHPDGTCTAFAARPS